MNIKQIETPAYIIHEESLIKNLEILKSVMNRTDCKILLAQKAFSGFAFYPLIGEYLSGSTASSLFEARLGAEEMGKETHIFAPSFKEKEMDEILKYCNHIVFNSPSQWIKHRKKVQECGKKVSCGIRINPEYSEIETDIYNPCFQNSRLGTTSVNFLEEELEGIEGLHFHTMCEQGADTLERTLEKVEEKFGKYFYRMKWINFGGGHHITKEGYDLEKLIQCINKIKEKYKVQVYLEPGEAVALNAGFLVAEVQEIIENNMKIAILDTSAACHMPDVLEMPYRPKVIGAGFANEKAYTYRFGGPTCLAGDIIGDYSFDEPLQIGSKVLFCDMAIYSMVKNNTFNGINLPSIVMCKSNGEMKVIREFFYEDFKNRLS
jgi:carboxynorspermidine decarboxylase